MASNSRIKGITIQLDGDPTKLDKALEEIDKSLESTQRSLKDVDRLLKLDPTNTVLLAQKQELLQNAIQETERRMDKLKEADRQAKAQLERGDLSKEKYDALQREIVATEQKLKSMEDSAQNMANGVKDAAGKMGDAFSDAGEQMESIGKKLDAGNMMEAADAIAGAGEKIVQAGEKAVGAFTDLEGATSRVNGYFGLTGEAAKQMGSVVETVFRSGITDSLDEVAQGVITVKNNLKDLDPSQLATITEQAINMEKVFGSDMNETMRGVNALMVNFGLDAQTAMDMVVRGTQNGLDKTQELGDNLSEYSGKFSQAGYSAEEYFQLLENGLDAGAYNLDKVNDSINEVTTRLGDGTIEESLGLFSEGTQEVFRQWQKGGASQKDVINAIVSDIQNAQNQQEAMTMASTAFGTLAEDANLGVIESLTTMGDSYSDVAGAAQEMSDITTTPMQEMQKSINDLQLALAPMGQKLVELATKYLPQVINVIVGLIEKFMSLPGPVKQS